MANCEAMFERIMENEGVFYKLQQRDDPDLTEEDKRTILLDLFRNNPRLFISRYFSYLLPEDCCLFDNEDYDIAFYIKKIDENFKNLTKNAKLERNIRYAELERLKRESDYFSYVKMREREPLLFDKMVGKFLSEEEQIFLRPTIENESLSGLLMQFEESQIISDRRKMQIDEDVFGFEVKNRDELDASLIKFGKLALHAECRQSPEKEFEENLEEGMESLSIQSEASISQPEDILIDSDDEKDKEQLKNDFIDFMEQRFLREKDAEFFDYAALYNQRYSKELDRMRNQDIEDAYFADE